MLVLLLAAVVAPSLALDGIPLELEWDACPPPPRAVLNFNPQKFVGTWFDVERYKNAVFTGQCSTAYFSWIEDDEILRMDYQNTEKTEHYQLRAKDLRNGEFRLYRNGRRTPIVWYLLDTDYVNYAVFWSCTDILYGVGSAQTMNVLSRTRTLDSALRATAVNAIASRDLDERKLEIVEQGRRTCGRRRD